jgi:hypothetical protein
MKTFPRELGSNYFAVFQDKSLWYRIGIYVIPSIPSEEEPKPFYVHKPRFVTRELAESVCEVISEEYRDGYSDGQGSCY